MTTALRPLSTGELLDRTFYLYRNHFALFVGIFALPQLCMLALQFVNLALKAPGAKIYILLAAMFMLLGDLVRRLRRWLRP